jgi:hypothetical protein
MDPQKSKMDVWKKEKRGFRQPIQKIKHREVSQSVTTGMCCHEWRAERSVMRNILVRNPRNKWLIGRFCQCWLDKVIKQLKNCIKIEKARNRDSWKDLIETCKNFKGLLNSIKILFYKMIFVSILNCTRILLDMFRLSRKNTMN